MNFLVDTPVWSAALRRRRVQRRIESGTVALFEELVREGRVLLLGPVRQELLSGIREKKQYDQLREGLRAFDHIPIVTEDYERGADFFNRCRRKGIQGSHIDFLICAVSSRLSSPIFTTDRDFEKYARHLDIKLAGI